MIFVIAMAGESQRFRDAGYGDKYRLTLEGVPLFDHAVKSFSYYFGSEEFLFVLRPDAEEFVRQRCASLGIAQAQLVVLPHVTSGQAESVFLGLKEAGITEGAPLTIFNIDTFRPGYCSPPFQGSGDLEVFEGEGGNWSFVAPDPRQPWRVGETSEKRPISRLCCTGLYRFAAAKDFCWAFQNPVPPQGQAEHRERYIAPLYNALIARGDDIRYSLISRDAVIFCGTPEEYEALCSCSSHHA
jgi:hypothetical protein